MPRARAPRLYAPDGRILAEGDRFRFEQLGDALERRDRGTEPFYSGEVAERVSGWVLERGGTLGPDDLAAYRAGLREPVQAAYRGRDVLTNPPPSPGGLLIAFALSLLDRAGDRGRGRRRRGHGGGPGLREPRRSSTGCTRTGTRDGSSRSSVDTAAERVRGGWRPRDRRRSPGDRLGSTTHITAVDARGAAPRSPARTGPDRA